MAGPSLASEPVHASYQEMQVNYQSLDWEKGVKICGTCKNVAFVCPRSDNATGGMDMLDSEGKYCTCSKKCRVGCSGMKLITEKTRTKKALCPTCTLAEFCGDMPMMMRYVTDCAMELLTNDCGCTDCCRKRQFLCAKGS